MIGSLELEAFGKFAKASFDLKPVTLFYGPNEAGKSTLFDALAFAICGPNGLKEKSRSKRYGKTFSARVTGRDGKAWEGKVEATEFYSFYAIRSEGIDIPISGEGVWVEKVRNSLFAGGINPDVMAKALEKSLNAANRKKEEERLSQECMAQKARIDGLRSSLEDCARAKIEAGKEAAKVKSLEAELARTTSEREGLAAKREREAAAARFREDRATLAQAEALETLRAKADRTDETAALRGLRESSRAKTASRQELGAREALLAQAAGRLHSLPRAHGLCP